MNWIVEVVRENGSVNQWIGIRNDGCFGKVDFIERAFQTDEEDAEDLASAYSDYYRSKGYPERTQAVLYEEKSS